MAQTSSNIVGVHYKIGKKIGEGSFGVIYEGVNLLNNQQVAMKFEPRKCEAPQLRDEYRAYRILNGAPGIPKVYFFGQEGVHNILILDLLGPSLEDLFDWCGRRFSVKTVVLIAKQMITRVEAIHDRSLIYRDIKPDNFLVGRPGTADGNQLFVVDFGMAKQYRDPKTKVHIPYREKKALSGTARYMSINTHRGCEQLRRDDLESLGHVFFYFLRGSLPWQGLKAPTNKQKYEKIGYKKQVTPINELCYGFPIQFAQYLSYVRDLKFDETPDYEYLISLMDKALVSINKVDDEHYDWMDLNNGKGWDASLSRRYSFQGKGMARNLHQVQSKYDRLGTQSRAKNTKKGQQRTTHGVNTMQSHAYSFTNYNSMAQAKSNLVNQNKAGHTLTSDMIPVRDDGEIHSDMSSSEDIGTWSGSLCGYFFCCC